MDYKESYDYEMRNAHPDFRKDLDEFLERVKVNIKGDPHITEDLSVQEEHAYLVHESKRILSHMSAWQGDQSPSYGFRMKIKDIAKKLEKRSELLEEYKAAKIVRGQK